MAIKQNISTEHGIAISDAYGRVNSVRIVTKARMAFALSIYADTEKIAIQEKYFECDYDLNGDNPIAQAYAHLKTLPEFADAVDC